MRITRPRESNALRVRSPTWVVLCALAERVAPDGTVRVYPAALARTVGLSDRNVVEAVEELARLGALRVVREISGGLVADISAALNSNNNSNNALPASMSP